MKYNILALVSCASCVTWAPKTDMFTRAAGFATALQASVISVRSFVGNQLTRPEAAVGGLSSSCGAVSSKGCMSHCEWISEEAHAEAREAYAKECQAQEEYVTISEAALAMAETQYKQETVVGRLKDRLNSTKSIIRNTASRKVDDARSTIASKFTEASEPIVSKFADARSTVTSKINETQGKFTEARTTVASEVLKGLQQPLGNTVYFATEKVVGGAVGLVGGAVGTVCTASGLGIKALLSPAARADIRARGLTQIASEVAEGGLVFAGGGYRIGAAAVECSAGLLKNTLNQWAHKSR